MGVPVKPNLSRAFGNDSWAFIPAVADITAPKIAEVNASSGFNFSCNIFGEQDGFSQSTDKVKLPRLNCETETYEVSGETSVSMADAMLAWDPQGASASVGKKAWESMPDLAKGFLVRRQGKVATSDFAAGDFVDIVPVQLGKKMPGKTGNGADGVYAFMQSISITGAPAWNKAIVA